LQERPRSNSTAAKTLPASTDWQNLVNFGALPLTFEHEDDYRRVERGDVLALEAIGVQIQRSTQLAVQNVTQQVRHELSPRQVEIVVRGGLIAWTRDRLHRESETVHR
jgi:aconitate hydratase